MYFVRQSKSRLMLPGIILSVLMLIVSCSSDEEAPAEQTEAEQATQRNTYADRVAWRRILPGAQAAERDLGWPMELSGVIGDGVCDERGGRLVSRALRGKAPVNRGMGHVASQLQSVRLIVLPAMIS